MKSEPERRLPLLAWLLLLLIAGGCLVRSGLFSRRQGYRDRIALRFSLALLLAYVAFLPLLTAMPHALLLSATGSLFPSVFLPASCLPSLLVSCSSLWPTALCQAVSAHSPTCSTHYLSVSVAAHRSSSFTSC